MGLSTPLSGVRFMNGRLVIRTGDTPSTENLFFEFFCLLIAGNITRAADLDLNVCYPLAAYGQTGYLAEEGPGPLPYRACL